ncbi:MAG: Maf family protein [bacterium]
MGESSNMAVLLASASPRRIELLKSLVTDFVVLPCDVDEGVRNAEPPVAYALRVATLKAREAEGRQRDLPCRVDWILGADTIVVVDDTILGKPQDAHEARSMLRTLQGRKHEVMTGICLLHPLRGLVSSEVVCTEVWMRPLAEAEIEAYVGSPEPYDKAGGYAIQGLGGRLVERIDGSYSNVVGLPLERLAELFERFGIR